MSEPTDKFLTTSEVAARLRVCRQQVTALCRKGDLPHHRFGEQIIRIAETDLVAYIQAHKHGEAS